MQLRSITNKYIKIVKSFVKKTEIFSCVSQKIASLKAHVCCKIKRPIAFYKNCAHGKQKK